MNTSLITETKDYCQQLFNQSRCRTLPFHNWEHTTEVAETAIIIARGENLLQSDVDLLSVASYFPDIGQIQGVTEHEEKSCAYAERFLLDHNGSTAGIDKVKEVILATKMPQQPQTSLQYIICDADLSHLGKTSFFEKNERLRSEWFQYSNKTFSDKEWITLNIAFLQYHQFYTAFAKNQYQSQKEINLRLLQQRLQDV